MATFGVDRPEVTMDSYMKRQPVVWVDLETTGLNPLVGEIIEFAGIKLVDGREVDRLALKIRPRYITDPPPNAQHVIPAFDRDKWAEGVAGALKVNGYTPEAWAGAYEYEEGIALIADFVKGAAAWGGQNVSFDAAFIEAKIRDRGLLDSKGTPVRLPYHKLDTVALAYEHLVPLGLNKLGLSKPGGICDFLGIPTEGAHKAMADVLMARKVWDTLCRAGWLQRCWWWLLGPGRCARALARSESSTG